MATAKNLDPDAGYVLADEVCAYLGCERGWLLARLDGEVAFDWAKRPVIPASTARKLVDDRERAEREREERQAEAARRRREWEAARERFIVEAMTELSEDFRRRWAEATAQNFANAEDARRDLLRLVPPPHVREQVREGLREALERWDRQHPPPPRPEEVA